MDKVINGVRIHLNDNIIPLEDAIYDRIEWSGVTAEEISEIIPDEEPDNKNI